MKPLSYQIAVLSGDGIGPEVMNEAIKIGTVLNSLLPYTLVFKEAFVGGAAFEVYGSHLPEETLSICKESSAILFGSVGGPVQERHLPKWQNCEINSILALRKAFQFSANLRPTRVLPALVSLSPLKKQLAQSSIDFVIVRELLGDCYFGEHTRLTEENGSRSAFDAIEYNEHQITQVSHHAFKVARTRRKNVVLAHKANVLATSKLWQEVVKEISTNYKDVEFREELIDSCAMQLILKPSSYDVILTSNMFGDILSDLASALPGSLGLSPSASLTSGTFGLYEPSGGSAPDIAGLGIANPCAQILSLALLLRYSLGDSSTAQALEAAVEDALTQGSRTKDISVDDNFPAVSTSECGDAICHYLKERLV